MPKSDPLYGADGLQGDCSHGGGVRQEYAGKYRYLYCADIIRCIGEFIGQGKHGEDSWFENSIRACC